MATPQPAAVTAPTSCAHVLPALPMVTQVLTRLMALPANVGDQCEVEARLGQCRVDAHGRPWFQSGVDASFVASLLCQLEASTAWTARTSWTQTVDRFFTLPDGGTCRTSTSVDGAGELCVQHVRKTTLESVDLQWRPPAAATATPLAACVRTSDDGHVYDVRVALKSEVPVPISALPVRVDDITLVRVKHRRSFVYTPTGATTPQWSIDISQVWTQPTYLEALACLRAFAGTQYEVEIELLRPRQYLVASSTPATLAAAITRAGLSLLLKTADLFEPAIPTGQLRLAASGATLAMWQAYTPRTAV